MDYLKVGSIKKLEIQKKFRDENEVNFECYALTIDEEQYLINILRFCLKEIGKEQIFEYLSYCFREIIKKAKKANTKRVFFEEMGFDINNKE